MRKAEKECYEGTIYIKRLSTGVRKIEQKGSVFKRSYEPY